MNIKLILLSAFGGALAAFKTDVDAYKAHPDPKFDWKVAASRWLQGAIAGALAGAGFGAVGA